MFCSQCAAENEDAATQCVGCGVKLAPDEPPAPGPPPDDERSRVQTALTGMYEILEELGRGGMAIVYLARETALDRLVALKVLPVQFTFDAQFVERFLREARTAARLRHPNVITIHSVGQEGPVTYFTTEYIEGESLAGRIQKGGTLPTHELVRIGAQVCDGLAHAHAEGVIHRDIKPDNIMIDRDDRAILMDFGVAKAARESKLTATGTTIGTPYYMSPEQIRGDRVDARSDLYSLGIVLYEMATGRLPFEGELSALQYRQINEPPPSPRTLNANIPPWFESVIVKALAKDPDQRFQSAAEMADALRSQQTVGMPATSGPGQPTRRAPQTPLEPSTPTVPEQAVRAPSRNSGRRHRGLGVVAAALVVLVGGGSLYYAHHQRLLDQEARGQALAQQVRTHLATGKQQLAAADYPAATMAFQEVLRLDPGHIEATLLLREAEKEVQRAAEALKEGQSRRLADAEAERQRQSQIEGYLSSGRQKLDSGDLTGAIAAFRAALKLDPRHAQATELLGKAELERQEEQAREAQTRVERTRQAQIGTYLSSGKRKLDAGDYPGAIADLQAARKLDPEHAEALVLLSEAGKRQQAESEAGAAQKRLAARTRALQETVLIPAGTFAMGSEEGSNDEKPVHEVRLAAFRIDKYEVTNMQYKAFADANPHWRKGGPTSLEADADYLKHWDEAGYPEGKGDHPVTYVSWLAAAAYAKWAGKRLPTEAEWEYAARGGLVGKKYPTGSISSREMNYDRNVGQTTPVDAHPANGYGVHDMAGNVWEWCSDWYGKDYYRGSPGSSPGGEPTGFFRVLRGGSFDTSGPYVRCAKRFFGTPTYVDHDVGFRCVSTP